jgi:hypothetical protein
MSLKTVAPAGFSEPGILLNFTLRPIYGTARMFAPDQVYNFSEITLAVDSMRLFSPSYGEE